MPTLLQYLLAIGTFQGVLLSALLLFTRHINYASRVLGVWCGFLATGLLIQLFQQEGDIQTYGILLAVTGFMPASFGALLYLYCRHSVLDDSFKARDLLHFIPFVSCYVLNIDLLLDPDRVVQTFLLGTQAPSVRYLLSEIIMFGQAYIYMVYTAVFIYQYQQRAQNNYAGFNPDTFYWLWIVQGFNLIIWSIKTTATVQGDGTFLSVAGDILIVFLIYGIGLAQWRNPQLFKVAIPLSSAPASKTQEAKTAGALEADTRVAIMHTINQYMQSQQAFLDSELSLRRLSDAVDISTHHLSEALNQEEGQNFYNYVNRFRIEYVCQQLAQDQELKLLDIGLQAGFSSKSTFNAVFKKHTGQTPTQYRANRLR